MEKIKLFICLFLSTSIVASCYKDKGNYDYKELNEIEVKGLESSYERDQDDSLNIHVSLEGTQYSDTAKFTYEWEIARKIVYTSKDLKFKVDLAANNHLGRFVVTDKSNGDKAHFRFNLRVSSATAGDVLVVLSKYNGEAEMSYKRLDKEGPFAVNYYRERFGVSLGTEPKTININYLRLANNAPFADNITLGTMQILTKEGLKIVDKNTMGPKADFDKITASSFTAILPPYPVQDVSNYNPEFVLYQHDMWNHNPYGGINQSGRMYMISSGALYYNGMTSFNKTIRVNQKADGGYLAPAMCYAYITNSPPDTRPNATLKIRGYDVSSYTLLFDNTNGKFLYSNAGAKPSLIRNTANEEYLPSFPGYKMLYASHTSTPGKCIAILHNGTQAKIVYLTVPGSSTQQTTIPFAINGTVDVSNDIINAKSRFHNMRYSPYMIISSGGKLYRYNVLNVLSGSGPTDVIANLTQMGYDGAATINAFTVSRTEKNLLMAVSRYVNNEAGNGPAMGDVIKMKLDNSTIGLQFDTKYEAVSGNPVDIKIKYQTYLRDGLDPTDVLIDKI